MSFDYQYADGYKVYVSTTGQAVPSDFTEVYSVAAENSDWTHHIVDITSLTGNKDIYVAFQNNSTDKYYLAVDNIRVYNPNDVDASVTAIDLNDLTQIDVVWQLNDGEKHSNTIQNLNLGIGQSYYYRHTDSVVFDEGSNNIKVWVENPNGVADQSNENDTLNFSLKALGENGDRKILLEHFTQASCGPCATQNPGFFALISNSQNKDNVAHIGYHTWWPGVDPMYNFNESDVKSRVDYYGVSAVPHLVMAGNHAEGSPGQIGQKELDTENSLLGIFKLNLDSRFESNNLEITLKAKALTDITKYDKVTVRLALVEDKTYSSAPGTNGEKSFPNVMRKMFPSADGTEWKNVMKNDSIELNFTYTVPSEIDIANCSLVAFIQNDSTKVANDLHIYPNPTHNFLRINADAINKIEMIDLNGRIVLKKEFHHAISELNLNISSLNKGFYLLKTYSSKKVSQTKFIKE